jgi:hypothetical protein
MIHNHSFSITHHDSRSCESCVMLWQWLWIMMCYIEPVGVIHGVLCWASGCESWCVMLNKWLWIMMCYAEPVAVNHGVLRWGSGCESWCAMLRQSLWIMVYHVEPVIVNLDSQPLAQNNTPLFITTGSAYHTTIHNHWFSKTSYHLKPLAGSQ